MSKTEKSRLPVKEKRRMDEVLKTMLNTPPKPHDSKKKKSSK